MKKVMPQDEGAQEAPSQDVNEPGGVAESAPKAAVKKPKKKKMRSIADLKMAAAMMTPKKPMGY